MSNHDNTLSGEKVQERDKPRKGDWPTAATRVTPEELHLIDAAAYKLRIKRAALLHEALMTRVREVLEIPAA